MPGDGAKLRLIKIVLVTYMKSPWSDAPLKFKDSKSVLCENVIRHTVGLLHIYMLPGILY